MEEKDILEAVKNKTYEENGKLKLSCASAFKIAGELKVGLSRIGDICNREGIRISNCQLGCFK
jgi:molybdate transport system regulatory protein